MDILDIVEGCPYPASALSNFGAYAFVFDGVACGGMEGLLQSLKFEDPEKQLLVCALFGKKAKFKGKKSKWFLTQTLWWKGAAIDRHSPAYQEFLDKAFLALSENEAFRQALKDTGEAQIRHSMGKSDPSRTVLTEEEFCSRLMDTRRRLYGV